MTSKCSYFWVFPRILTLELRFLCLKFYQLIKQTLRWVSHVTAAWIPITSSPQPGWLQKVSWVTFQFLASHFSLPRRVCAQLLQSYPILCDAMNYSLPVSSVHEILQARILEWVAIPYSGDLLYPGIESTSPVSPAFQPNSLPSEPVGETIFIY